MNRSEGGRLFDGERRGCGCGGGLRGYRRGWWAAGEVMDCEGAAWVGGLRRGLGRGGCWCGCVLTVGAFAPVGTDPYSRGMGSAGLNLVGLGRRACRLLVGEILGSAFGHRRIPGSGFGHRRISGSALRRLGAENAPGWTRLAPWLRRWPKHEPWLRQWTGDEPAAASMDRRRTRCCANGRGTNPRLPDGRNPHPGCANGRNTNPGCAEGRNTNPGCAVWAAKRPPRRSASGRALRVVGIRANGARAPCGRIAS